MRAGCNIRQYKRTSKLRNPACGRHPLASRVAGGALGRIWRQHVDPNEAALARRCERCLAPYAEGEVIGIHSEGTIVRPLKWEGALILRPLIRCICGHRFGATWYTFADDPGADRLPALSRAIAAEWAERARFGRCVGFVRPLRASDA